MREIAERLGKALDLVDDAIAIRDEEGIPNLKDLNILRAEIHAITCRPQLEPFYRARA